MGGYGRSYPKVSCFIIFFVSGANLGSYIMSFLDNFFSQYNAWSLWVSVCCRAVLTLITWIVGSTSLAGALFLLGTLLGLYLGRFFTECIASCLGGSARMILPLAIGIICGIVTVSLKKHTSILLFGISGGAFIAAGLCRLFSTDTYIKVVEFREQMPYRLSVLEVILLALGAIALAVFFIFVQYKTPKKEKIKS